MRKQFFDDMKGLLQTLFPVAIIIALIALAHFVAYKIAVSDLPPWFKFWLLRGS